MVTSTKLETTESMRSPVALPSDVLTSMNRQAGSSFIVRFFGMVQMRVTPGPQNQAQRTQSVSPIGLVVNGLHCAASHTHTTSLRCHPHVPTFEPCPIWPCEVASKERRSTVIISDLDYPTSTQARLPAFLECLFRHQWISLTKELANQSQEQAAR